MTASLLLPLPLKVAVAVTVKASAGSALSCCCSLQLSTSGFAEMCYKMALWRSLVRVLPVPSSPSSGTCCTCNGKHKQKCVCTTIVIDMTLSRTTLSITTNKKLNDTRCQCHDANTRCQRKEEYVLSSRSLLLSIDISIMHAAKKTRLNNTRCQLTRILPTLANV